MNTIAIRYTLKWQIIFAPQYKFTTSGLLINCTNNRVIKKTVNGGQPGYWIKGDWWSLKKLKPELEKIKYEKLPF